MKAKFAPAYIAGELARERGGCASAAQEGQRVTLSAMFAAPMQRAANVADLKIA
jgi:hypothetical protein